MTEWWSDGVRKFWLMLSFSPRKLQAFRRYIKLNPDRALWKTRNPDRFIRRGNIRHAILPRQLPFDERSYRHALRKRPNSQVADFNALK